MKDIVPVEKIANKIYVIRHMKVMLDKDLADLYGVETRVLNQAVKRHKKRFPNDFMFQLSKSEYEFLISQFVTSKNSGMKERTILTQRRKAAKRKCRKILL